MTLNIHRFFYDSSASPTPFTTAQLQELRRSSLARVTCDNGDAIRMTALPNLYPHFYPVDKAVAKFPRQGDRDAKPLTTGWFCNGAPLHRDRHFSGDKQGQCFDCGRYCNGGNTSVVFAVNVGSPGLRLKMCVFQLVCMFVCSFALLLM